MKLKIVGLTILKMLLISFPIIVQAAGGLGYAKIESVAHQSNGFYLYSSGWQNPNACERSDAVVLLKSDSNYDKAYSLVLSAFMAGKEISGYSDRCEVFDGKTYNMIRGHKYLTVR